MKLERRLAHVLTICAVVLFIAGCPDENGTLRVKNDTTYPISKLQMKDSTALGYGDNLLPQDIQPGETFDLTDIEPGTYDFQVTINTIVDSQIVFGYAWLTDTLMYPGRSLTWRITESKSAQEDVVESSVEFE